MKIKLLLLFVLFVLYSNLTFSQKKYQVGPDKPYTSLQQVTSLLLPGDTVFVDGNTSYPGNVNFTVDGSLNSKIVIKGVIINGNRPVIAGGTSVANTVIFNASHYVFEGLEVTGGTNRGIFHVADDITIRNCKIHDCPNQGLLGADGGSGSLTLEYSELYNCGAGTQAHTIYMCTDQGTYPHAVFRMQYCYLHNSNGGNMIKTRSERNEIYYNWIQGGYYRELEMVGVDAGPYIYRMDGDVVGNVFVHTSTSTVTRCGGDGTGDGTSGRYRFVNNTFLFENGSGSSAIQIFTNIESIEMHNNVFYRKNGTAVNIINDQGATWTQGSPIYAGTNNWTMTGSTNIPSQWTGTLTGNANPGFVNLTTNDLHLVSGSSLVNAGNNSPTSPAGYTFPNPLFPPAFEPPLHAATTSAYPRTSQGTIDIGAYEYVTPSGIIKTISANANSEQLLIYPNPVTSGFTIKISSEIKIENSILIIYDVCGKEIRSISINAHETVIERGKLENGIYFYSVYNNNAIIGNGKLVTGM